MENAKISFRISTELKDSLIKEAKEGGLTLTQYILWIFDMYEEVNSVSVPQIIAEKTDLETPKIIKGSDTKFEAEFEKEINKIKQLNHVLNIKSQQAIEEVKVEKLKYV